MSGTTYNIIQMASWILLETPHSKEMQGCNNRGSKSKKAVDYASGRLLYDNYDLFRQIVKTPDTDLILLDDSLKAFLN